MTDITKKIFEIDDQEIDFTDEFKQRIETVFNDAVEKSNEYAYLDGVDDVIENMKKHGMTGTAAIVLENLVAEGIIEVADLEGKQNVDEGLSFAEIVAGQIG